MIKETNPGSYATCSWIEMENPERPLQFKMIFISFNSQIRGAIAGCRSLIGVDGTHLKGNHGGVLLVDVAYDGNNELFPIAVSVKGVEPALESVWPEAYRRLCARHPCKNFKKEYPGVLMYKLFWKVVNVISEVIFKKAMEQAVHHAGLGCARWFLDLGDKELWCKHMFDPSISSDENISNFVESFYNTIGTQRYLPVLSLFEGIRRVVMVRHATRQQISDKWQDDGITPNIRAIIRKQNKDSRTCEAFKSWNGEYEKRDDKSFLKVSLNKYECACALWQISGIPCKHATRAIISDNKDPYSYWPVFDVPNLEPPTIRRSIGRPSRNRRREPGEQRKGKRIFAVRCKKCKCFGHNSKTCKGGYTAKERNAIQEKVTKTRKKRLQKPSGVAAFESLQIMESLVMRVGSEMLESSAQGEDRNGKKQRTN
ncbi:uncharacterized protein LOC141587692 [Silene latifolia]|uniref:uncharacterized protein LOC141587692 n=1 Tax=Silene latifolia TaxID=37657 RepID=UPI003D771840